MAVYRCHLKGGIGIYLVSRAALLSNMAGNGYVETGNIAKYQRPVSMADKLPAETVARRRPAGGDDDIGSRASLFRPRKAVG